MPTYTFRRHRVTISTQAATGTPTLCRLEIDFLLNEPRNASQKRSSVIAVSVGNLLLRESPDVRLFKRVHDPISSQYNVKLCSPRREVLRLMSGTQRGAGRLFVSDVCSSVTVTGVCPVHSQQQPQLTPKRRRTKLRVIGTWWHSLVVSAFNVVNRHWVRLLLGWVTVCGQVNHLGIWPVSPLLS